MKVLFDTDVRIDAQKNPKEPYRSYLKTIAQLCKEGRIQPFLTDESEVEELRGMRIAIRHEDLFEEVSFELAQSTLRRSKWGLDAEQLFGPKSDGTRRDKGELNKYVIQFCQWLLNPSSERIERFISGMRDNPRHKLSTFEEKCFAKPFKV